MSRKLYFTFYTLYNFCQVPDHEWNRWPYNSLDLTDCEGKWYFQYSWTWKLNYIWWPTDPFLCLWTWPLRIWSCVSSVVQERYQWKAEEFLFHFKLYIHIYKCQSKLACNINPLNLDYLYFDTHCTIHLLRIVKMYMYNTHTNISGAMTFF